MPLVINHNPEANGIGWLQQIEYIYRFKSKSFNAAVRKVEVCLEAVTSKAKTRFARLVNA